jgi:hypothetical protein
MKQQLWNVDVSDPLWGVGIKSPGEARAKVTASIFCAQGLFR